MAKLGLSSVIQCSWECLVNAWNSQIQSAQQLDLLKDALIENGQETVGHRASRPNLLGWGLDLYGRHSMCLPWEWSKFLYNSKIPCSFRFLTCLNIAKVMTRLITLICPGGAEGNRTCCRKDSSVGVTTSAPQMCIVNWEQVVFSSYFFFLPIYLALNKNWQQERKECVGKEERFPLGRTKGLETNKRKGQNF